MEKKLLKSYPINRMVRRNDLTSRILCNIVLTVIVKLKYRR